MSTSPQNIIRAANAAAVDNQAPTARRNNSITSMLTGVAQVIQVLAVVAVDGPLWLAAVFAAVLAVIEVIVQANSKGAVTPSQAEKLVSAYTRVSATEDAHAARAVSHAAADRAALAE